MNKQPEDYEITTKRCTDDATSYNIPAPLVHNILRSIVTAIVFLGGYMVVWGINDASFKSQVLTELGWMKDRVVEIGDDQDEHEQRKHDAYDQ